VENGEGSVVAHRIQLILFWCQVVGSFLSEKSKDRGPRLYFAQGPLLPLGCPVLVSWRLESFVLTQHVYLRKYADNLRKFVFHTLF
jgi:hypothetical protein